MELLVGLGKTAVRFERLIKSMLPIIDQRLIGIGKLLEQRFNRKRSGMRLHHEFLGMECIRASTFCLTVAYTARRARLLVSAAEFRLGSCSFSNTPRS